MTARVVINEIKKLPRRERGKVFAWVDRELAEREDTIDRAAVLKVKASIAAGEKPVPFKQVCREMGL